MTWCSECSAVPGFVLAKSAIRCLFVDRFVGSSVPSHVSGQRVSTRGVSLPSAGSQQARFPVVISTMEALRLPASACPVPYGFGSRPHVFLLWFVLAKSAPGERGGRSAGLGVCSAGVPLSGVHPVGACGTSQVPWQSIPCPCPAPGPRPSQQDLAFDGLVDTALGN